MHKVSRDSHVPKAGLRPLVLTFLPVEVPVGRAHLWEASLLSLLPPGQSQFFSFLCWWFWPHFLALLLSPILNVNFLKNQWSSLCSLFTPSLGDLTLSPPWPESSCLGPRATEVVGILINSLLFNTASASFASVSTSVKWGL